MLPDPGALSVSLVAEIVKALGLPRTPFMIRIFHHLFHRATDRLAALGLAFDQDVARHGGLQVAAQNLLTGFCHPAQANGVLNIPGEGPLLILSNHPGTFDSLVLMSQVHRGDVRVIASRIPFVSSLPNASRHFIFVTIDAHERMNGIRQAIRHLQAAGTLLIFGSGHIDPDPGVYRPVEAVDHLQQWWPSAGYLLEKMPGTSLVLSMVSHVVSPRWAHHPITWLRRGGVNRRRLGELGQLVQHLAAPQRMPHLSPCVSFSRPYHCNELLADTGDDGTMPAILQRATSLFWEHVQTFKIALPGPD